MRVIFTCHPPVEPARVPSPAGLPARRHPSGPGRRVCLLAALVLWCGVTTAAAAGAPVLISEPTSTRAVALTTPTFQTQPFPLTCAAALCEGQRTRVMLFIMGLALQPGEAASSVTARAEDGTHRFYDLAVEHVERVHGHEWMSVIILRLGDEMGDAGDVLVGVRHRGADSNRVRLGVGRLGGGPADDAGAFPTPAPPFTLGGFARDGVAGIGGVRVTVGGSLVASFLTGADGSFALGAQPPGGSYTLTPSKPCYSFSPASARVENLYRNTSVNFAGAENRIDGRVLDAGGRPIAAVAVALGGAQPGAAQTAAGGAFSFACLTPGDYTVTPSHAQYDFAPASQTFGALAGPRAADFTGTLKQFTVRGRVTTPGGVGVGGATVSLVGPQTRTAVTAPDGGYAFDGVTAKGDYTVNVSRAHYDFAPPRRAFHDLDADRTANFTGIIHHFKIRGRVTAGGQPLASVQLHLGGPQTATAVADADGNYSFEVPAEGDYTITPSPLHFYAYDPPARSFVFLAADSTADFSATPVAPPATQQVLEWDGSPQTVDYDYFFDSPGDLGRFFWEFWAMPGADAGGTYLLSDGHGGAHALLFGFGNFGTTEPGRYQFIGNVWDGAGFVSFSSDEGPAVGEWGHFAVGWDGKEIVTYLNGVPVGRTPFAGPRREGGYNNGGGRLLIGGSDHSNLIGRIAQVRGFEGANPREGPSGLGPTRTRSAYAPDTVFRTGGQLLSNYFEPRQTVADLSAGFRGTLHAGRLRGTPHPYGLLTFCEHCPRPRYVVDPTAPDFAAATGRSRQTYDPPPAPAGALASDSFTRRNSTHALGAGGLGQTEGGSAGPLPWRLSPPTPQGAAFGILNERAVVLADGRALAWVVLPPAAPASGHDLRVRRRSLTRAAGFDTGLAFRVADADNHFFAYTTGDDHDRRARLLTVGYYLNGRRRELATGLPVAGDWVELSVVTTPAGAIRVYANSELVYSTTHGLFAEATGAGLYNDGPGLGLANRWDDFAAYELPDQQARSLPATAARLLDTTARRH